MIDTRESLLIRLRDRQDREAWEQFIEIYRPFLFRLARSRGFQEADSSDLVQEVFLAVSRKVHEFVPDPERGKFRAWLGTIARNAMIHFLTRRQYKPTAPIQSLSEQLEEFVDPMGFSAEISALFDLEYRRELFHIAGQRVQLRVHANTWKAFHRSAVEGADPEMVGRELGMTPGAVLVAKCRVIAKLRNEVQRLEESSSSGNSLSPSLHQE
ncbi:RNA polymerase sigma factor [Pirellula sp. SH-Sr6A]|uniref:RNA polymerase sigma factor n=1 Tax=Pirellula sp. SH-Sr6A TaxID=1632865 RepID=UPI00078E750F|nr:sigma-70 family RNA polymerase sigma factor [Pirellula sp. SH-Sr6A]AMV34452.1 RNA polymerase sigma factor [Pirellula sp. SH-Sr6A]